MQGREIEGRSLEGGVAGDENRGVPKDRIRYCGNCVNRCRKDDRFCNRCGKKQEGENGGE